MEAIDNDDMFVVIIDKEDGGPSKRINNKDTNTYAEISIKQEMNESVGKAGLKKLKTIKSTDLKMASKVRTTVDKDSSATEGSGKESAISDHEIAIKSLKADIEQVIQTAEKYGQIIEIKFDGVKKEPETLQDNKTNTEYLQEHYTDEHSEEEILSEKKYRKEIELHGIKQEPEMEDNETDPEYIQDDISDEYSDDESLIERKNLKKTSPSKISASNLGEKNKRKESFGASQSIPHRRKMLEESEQFSLVDQLRLDHPKLAKDSNLLIDTLTDMMLATKQPQPPENVYTILTNNKYECLKCGATSETEPAAERHWREKHGPRYLFCYACGADFRSTTILYKHEMRCNAADVVWVLKARARSLGRKARARPFLDHDRPRKKKPKSTRRFTCSLCPNFYTTMRALQAHEHVHTGLRPYKCPLCPNAYTSRLGLNKHSVKHTGSKFICDSCGRSLQSKDSLITHLETHAAVRKFACAACPRRFTQKAALRLHEARKHSAAPPREPCQLCHKRFHQMSLLKAHMLKEHGMSLITRKMFYQTLPKLTDTQVEKAKVVFNTNISSERAVAPEPRVTTQDRELKPPTASVERRLKKKKEQEPIVRLPEPSVTTPDREHKPPTASVERRLKKKKEQEPIVPKALMGYIKNLSQTDKKCFVIQNGQAIFLNGENIDYFRSAEEYITP